MQTLYRKFRPQSFKEVFGQEVIVKVLKRQVEDGNVGHAYLFAGPRGTGKTTMARLVAKSVNCKKMRGGEPCRKCDACLAVEKGRFLDLIEIDAASNRGIDEIRRLREKVGFAPSEGNSKVYIIDEVHMLTKDAFNALLKTLEEPPSHVIFILATTEAHKIPATILSRCQRFNFTLADEKTILERLKYICKKEGVDFTKDALMAIVKNSAGSFRDAESILEKVIGGIGVIKDKQVDIEDVGDILGLAEEIEVKNLVDMLLEQDTSASLKIFDKIANSGANLFQFLRQALEYCRELLLQKVTKKRGDFRMLDLILIISELSEAENRLKFSSVARLPIEVAIVKICSPQETKDISLSTGKGRINSAKRNSIGGIKKNIGGLVSGALTKIPKKLKTSFRREASPGDQALKSNQSSIRAGVKSKKSLNSNPKGKVDLCKVTKDWNKIVEKISPFNHHLSAFFKKAQPINISGKSLLVHVPFRFHKQRIESSKAREVFSKVTKEVFGVALNCVCEVNGDAFLQEEEDSISHNGEVVLEVLGDIIE